MSLPERVLTARKKKGLTQEELAELTKLTARTIQRIESGETTPRPYTLKAIAAALDISFEALQATETDLQESTDSSFKAKTLHYREDIINFLKLFCLSCFSYLVLPFVHFLIPIYLLKKRKEQNPIVLAYARAVIKFQVYWVITLNLLLLLTLAYNTYCSIYLNSSYLVNYLVPLLGMYGVNALVVVIAFLRIKKIEPITPSLSI